MWWILGWNDEVEVITKVCVRATVGIMMGCFGNGYWWTSTRVCGTDSGLRAESGCTLGGSGWTLLDGFTIWECEWCTVFCIFCIFIMFLLLIGCKIDQ